MRYECETFKKVTLDASEYIKYHKEVLPTFANQGSGQAAGGAPQVNRLASWSKHSGSASQCTCANDKEALRSQIAFCCHCTAAVDEGGARQVSCCCDENV